MRQAVQVFNEKLAFCYTPGGKNAFWYAKDIFWSSRGAWRHHSRGRRVFRLRGADVCLFATVRGQRADGIRSFRSRRPTCFRGSSTFAVGDWRASPLVVPHVRFDRGEPVGCPDRSRNGLHCAHSFRDSAVAYASVGRRAGVLFHVHFRSGPPFRTTVNHWMVRGTTALARGGRVPDTHH